MLENFYEILSSVHDGQLSSWRIRLNTDHEIFKAHFPGTPITPGACQLEIFRQLAGKSVGRELMLVSIKNLKYLQIIDPKQTDEVTVAETIQQGPDADQWQASVLVTCDDKVFTKASITLKAE